MGASSTTTAIPRRRHFGWLEICLLAALVALAMQFLPPGMRWWRDRPSPGFQVASEAELVDDDGHASLARYWIYLPTDYAPGRPSAMLLFLHGSGQSGDSLDQVLAYGPPRLLAAGQGAPMIVVSPQCAAGRFWDSRQLLALLDHVEQHYSVDPDRVYVAGFSVGGGGAWELAGAAPDRFAAVVSIAGPERLACAPRLTRPAVWAIHGELDRVVPARQSQTMVDAINAAGGHAQLTLFENEGHDICESAFERAKVYEWLQAQRRGQPSEMP